MEGNGRIPVHPLLQSELNGDDDVSQQYDRFDYKLAWPSSEHLKIQFTVLAVINGIVSASCLILIVAILRYQKVRRNSFNLYILFIAIPDFIVSFCCLLTCAMSAPAGQYYAEWMCSFQSFYLVFGFSANCWMNAVVVYEVHRLLRLSKRRAKYIPPSSAVVLKQTAVVYTYSTFLALLTVWDIPGLPQQTQLLYGFNCFPNDYDNSSTIFFYLVFIPAFIGIPVIYASYAMIDIWRRQLLPPHGRRRELAIYFSRVILVYFGMWTPFLIICSIGNFINLSGWVYWVGAAWSHIQGLVSCIVASTRPQIMDAIVDCYRCIPEKNRKERNRKRLRSSSSRFSWINVVNGYSSRNVILGQSTPDVLEKSRVTETSSGTGDASIRPNQDSMNDPSQSERVTSTYEADDEEEDVRTNRLSNHVDSGSGYESDEEIHALVHDKCDYNDGNDG